MKLKVLFLIIIQFVILNSKFSIIFSQPVNLEWVRTYPNASPAAVAMDTSGNIYITGGIGQNNCDYITIKYNSAGVEQWYAIYNGPSFNSVDQATCICTDKHGNIYVSGHSEQTGLWTDAFCTIKYNSSGIQQWVARYHYNPGGQDDPVGIAVDDSGNVYVAGSSTGIGYLQHQNYCTIKYNSNGDSVWVRRYMATGNPIMNVAIMYDMKIDEQANVYVTGQSSGYNAFIITIKYNSSGVQQWVAQTSGNGGNNGYMALDKYNNIYLTCHDEYGGIRLIKYNSIGVQQWITGIYAHGLAPNGISGIVVDSLSNSYINAFDGGNNGLVMYVTIKYTPNGDTLWGSGFFPTGSTNNYPYGITLDKYLNTYITGGSMDSNGIGHITTIKYNSNGSMEWLEYYPGHYGQCLITDNSLNVYVAGYDALNHQSVIIKYSQPNGIKRISSELPKIFMLYQNYPNPFNPTTKIKFSIPSNVKSETSNVRLVVNDILGREVATLVNDKLQPGSYEVEWDASGYASGVYFYRLSATEYTETKKMILMK